VAHVADAVIEARLFLLGRPACERVPAIERITSMAVARRLGLSPETSRAAVGGVAPCSTAGPRQVGES